MGNNPEQTLPLPPGHWPGLGGWNLYFLGKFVALAMGLLDFHVLLNLLFAAFLLVPLANRWLKWLRLLLALPASIALLYKDTWFPPFERLLAEPGILDFSASYLLELLERFINQELLGSLVLMTLGYFWLRHWLRLTTLSLGGLCWIAVAGMPITLAGGDTVAAVTGVQATTGTTAEGTPPGQPVSSATLDTWLTDFFNQERQRRTTFPARDEQAAPFDLLVLQICSMSWDDLDISGLKNHPLFGRMDLIFDQFNSATSYSGPAAIRLLRASCGQPSHADLYQPTVEQCLLFENLDQLGFSRDSLLNHSGRFDGFLDEVMAQRMPRPVLKNTDFRRALVAFDGSPVARDLDVLQGWWQRRQKQDTARASLFYNTISLHDGNRFITADGGTRSADYKTRAQNLLDDLLQFLDLLERSGRRVVLVIVPEHGAALHGDRMQIAGMREIPTPSITHVPVGVRLINIRKQAHDSPLHISAPTSLLALSELVSRLYGVEASGTPAEWQPLVAGLPETPMVSETAGAQVIVYQGVTYVRLEGQSEWTPYPGSAH